MLSGNQNDSLIRSSDLGVVILLTCGLVSLLIQFPIQSLRGEIASLPNEQKIRPSNCSVKTCQPLIMGLHPPWLYDANSDFYIFKILREQNPQASVIEENLNKGCSNISVLTTDTHYMTTYAFLLQYHTICNDPELLKRQLTYYRRRLLFEFVAPGYHATESLCSSAQGLASQIIFEEHFRMTKLILEHSLLSYPQVYYTLNLEEYSQLSFWSANTKEARKLPNIISDKIETTISLLEQKYDEYLMRDELVKLHAVDSEVLEVFLWLFLGVSLTIIFAFLLCGSVRVEIRRCDSDLW